MLVRDVYRLARLASSVAALALVLAGSARATSDIVNTPHNLSVSGTGSVRALTETRICVFCHTPHNAAPQSPLWNKDLGARIYTVYTSPTLQAGPLAQPTGPTKLCLSCHDGTIAMGAVLNPSTGISMTSGGLFPSGSLSNFGLDLSGHHPVSFPYQNALPNPELAPTPPADLVFGGTDELHCTTCHDPHDNTFGAFLAKDNRFSALCTKCHDLTGWETSAHATSTASVVGILPRPPKTSPTYTQLGEWGCESCHTPHFAPTAEELLNFTSDPPDPFSCTSAGCHNSQPPPAHGPGGSSSQMSDIATQVRKPSAHPESIDGTSALRAGRRRGRAAEQGVACSECHNPHRATSGNAEPPYASAVVQGVPGVDRNGAPVQAATYQYEICFKCHADQSGDRAFVPRAVPSTNTREAFDPANPSYHPVVAMGKNHDVPSIPSPYERSMNAGSLIYCTSCHADDGDVSQGPHGSMFAPILKARYETADQTPESFDNYALCYRCHDRDSILSDASFKRSAAARAGRTPRVPGRIPRAPAGGGGHSGHLAAGAPCSSCHDPHGVADPGGGASGTGDHTHLVNFDLRIVQPLPGNPYPIFKDGGSSSGSCSLICHGVTHDATFYP
ncbi:MAG: hypothetical protein IPK07_19895 [Deltaproteobacteria bacterium]|nr:hypothetical protein [Deltaproteobacteria bacterium]